MGLFGKMFGKKEEDSFDLGNIGGDDINPGMPPSDNMGDPFSEPMGMPPGNDPLGMNTPQQQYPPPAQHPVQQQNQGFNPEDMGFERVREKTPQQGFNQTSSDRQQQLNDIHLGKDIEIISAKLDTIKAELDSMNQRLKRIERIAEGETQVSQPKDKWGY